MPSVGSSKPPIMRSVVVLPQPEGPSIAKKLAALDLEREVVDGDHASVEPLGDVLEADVGAHERALSRSKCVPQAKTCFASWR